MGEGSYEVQRGVYFRGCGNSGVRSGVRGDGRGLEEGTGWGGFGEGDEQKQ